MENEKSQIFKKDKGNANVCTYDEFIVFKNGLKIDGMLDTSKD